MPAAGPQGIFACSLAKMTAHNMTETSGTKTPQPVIAVVDDDPAVCNSLKFSLELEGFSVRAFYSGTEFTAANNLEGCACFVIDQGLPDTNGMQLIEGLRARHIGAPAILVVGHPRAALAAQAAEAGIPIVEKPLLGNALLGMIRQICGLA
jgi:FixJ family two-component response regulator